MSQYIATCFSSYWIITRH